MKATKSKGKRIDI